MYAEQIKYDHLLGNNLGVDKFLNNANISRIWYVYVWLNCPSEKKRSALTVTISLHRMSYYLSQKLICTLRNVSKDRVTHLPGKKLLQNRMKVLAFLKIEFTPCFSGVDDR